MFRVILILIISRASYVFKIKIQKEKKNFSSLFDNKLYRTPYENNERGTKGVIYCTDRDALKHPLRITRVSSRCMDNRVQVVHYSNIKRGRGGRHNMASIGQ